MSVSIHDNRSTMISYRRARNRLHLRVHHMFLFAEPLVVRALAQYTRRRTGQVDQILDGFIDRHRGRIGRGGERKRAMVPRARGRFHELQTIFDQVNQRYFQSTIEARIGWGRGTGRRRRKSIRMGAYFPESRTILIHPALDRAEVPRLFVEFVVYHEMLHQAVPQYRTAAGHRSAHSPEFRAREKLFAEYARARAWEKANLKLLLRGGQRQVERADIGTGRT